MDSRESLTSIAIVMYDFPSCDACEKFSNSMINLFDSLHYLFTISVYSTIY